MKIFVLLIVACANCALAAPQGYTYKEPGPVIQHGNLNGFQPILGNGLPCDHVSHSAGSAALIQAQSNGRILNHQHFTTDNNFATAAAESLGHTQSQAVTVNSQIVVGESGSSSAGISGGSHEYQAGKGYVQGQFAGQPSTIVPLQQQLPIRQFQQLPQLSSHAPVPPFHFGIPAPARVPPAPLVSGQTQGYSYNQGGGASHISQNIHHHYAVPGPGAIINGVGKVPPPLHILNGQTQGFQYASGYGGNKFSSAQSDHFGADLNAHVPYRPQPIAPNGPVNFADNSPLQPAGAGYAQNFQHGANSYTGSYSQNSLNSAGSFGTSGSESLSGVSGSQFGSTLNQHSSSGSDLGLYNSVSTSGSVLDGQLGNVIRETFASAPLDPTIEKHIYVHVPPEDLEENTAKHTTFLPQQNAKKHYKIIFIKAPSAPQANYAQLASTAAQQVEEKTLVYVLVKKPEEPSFEEIQQIQQTVHKPSKPEVYFIKYKTRKENDANLPSFATSSGAIGSGSEQYNTGSTYSGSGGYNAVSGGIESSEGIDIRAGGDTNSISSSSTYSTSSNSLTSPNLNVGAAGEQKHELYGVPIE